MINDILIKIILLFRPFARKLAMLFDIAIYHHAEGVGRHPLVLEDYENSKRHCIPKCTVFNTMSGSIYVGRNTSFGHGVMVITGMHMGVDEANAGGFDLHHVPVDGRDISIGRHCFIGSGAIILGNVTIGDNSIIGAGSVITKNVPAGAFVAGIPAKVIHMQQGIL
jgi:acetyltransferase-like isoleucine patch superfamily enzyme